MGFAFPTVSAERSRLEAFTVAPAATNEQLVRLSLPFPPGALMENQSLEAIQAGRVLPVAVRALSWHATTSGARFVRRALVTFPFRFADLRPVQFSFRASESGRAPAVSANPRVTLKLDEEALRLNYEDGPTLVARPLWPSRVTNLPARVQLVESNAFYRWYRWHFPDPVWPRILEARIDALGTVAVVAHLQRAESGNGRAPAFGWQIDCRVPDLRQRSRGGDHAETVVLRSSNRSQSVEVETVTHSFSNGAPAELRLEKTGYRLAHPAAALKRCGRIEARLDPTTGLQYRYWRCVEADRVPMQEASWQRAEWTIAPEGQAPLTRTLDSPHVATWDGPLWDALYGCGPPLNLRGEPELERLLAYHHDAIVRSMAQGHDWGNVTGYTDGAVAGSTFGMNRLNHNAPIFFEYFRSGDVRLREVALLWCDNFFDQSIWWGPGQTGGTRYNNLRAQGQRPPDDDDGYMWRSNDSVHFCTKGYDSFWIAYEETGDPRMEEAFLAQTRYAAQHVHADRGECRNVGDVRDFMHAFAWTGQTNYLDEALRLFRELRTKLSAGDLFDQGGKALSPNPPFIEDDPTGSRYGYAKPYIIGYALAGLPALGRLRPAEPKLDSVVRAVADFLATSQDPIGGWRYPHPRSSYVFLNQGMEHAWQLVQADQWLGPQDKHLDAMERVLRQRILGWRKTGKILSGLTGWETAQGLIKQGSELNHRYARPEDRDAARDYVEGRAGFGSSPPEGLVYFPEVLAFYLMHRPASRLLAPASSSEPLGKVLERSP